MHLSATVCLIIIAALKHTHPNYIFRLLHFGVSRTNPLSSPSPLCPCNLLSHTYYLHIFPQYAHIFSLWLSFSHPACRVVQSLTTTPSQVSDILNTNTSELTTEPRVGHFDARVPAGVDVELTPVPVGVMVTATHWF